MTLSVVGFTADEHQHFQQLSRDSLQPGFQGPRLTVEDASAAHRADLVLIDGADAAAMAWSRPRSWLAHGVVVWVDSRTAYPGQTQMNRPLAWSELTDTLVRILTEHPRGAEGPMDAPGPQARPPQVMVVSHRPRQAARLAALLSEAGCRVEVASTAREGLAALHASVYDAVLMPARMPQVDGFDACRRIARLGRRLSHVPVALLGEASGLWPAWRARLAGARALTPEPQDLNALKALLARLGVQGP